MRDDGLSCLPCTICQTLCKGCDLRENAVNCQGICSQVLHDLPVEQNSDDSHSKVADCGRETNDRNIPELAKHRGRFHKSKGIFLPEEMHQHYDDRNILTCSCCKTGTEDAQIQNKHAEVIAEAVKNTADDDSNRCQIWIIVITKVCRQDVAEHAARHRKENRFQIFLCHYQQFIICSKETEKRLIEQANDKHGKNGQYCAVKN